MRFVFLIGLAMVYGGAALGEEVAAVTTVIDGFHDALRRSDAKAAMQLLAPDAMILENGFAETRAEYEQHHLQADIAFARATKTTRSPLSIHQEGNVAWATATSHTTGTFEGRSINSAGVELMVLTKNESGWRIRAIHWSSQRRSH